MILLDTHIWLWWLHTPEQLSERGRTLLSIGENQNALIIPHGQIGVTTVGKIREQGGDVVRTSGRSAHHATLIGLTPQEISSLLTPTISNPAKSN